MNRLYEKSLTTPLATDRIPVGREAGEYNITPATLLGTAPAFIGAALGFGLTGTPQDLSNSGTINSTTNVTRLTTDTPSVYTIADGTHFGQLKVVIMDSYGANGVLSTNIAAQTITWTGNNQAVVLMWDGQNWLPLAGTAAIVL